MSPAERGVESESVFGRLLREWRSRRRVSQLDLAVEAGVSSRHVSFIETGRAQPVSSVRLLLAGCIALVAASQYKMIGFALLT